MQKIQGGNDADQPGRRDGDGGTWDEVWSVVRAIPRGRVATYGQIAALLSRPLSARAVGWAMHACPDDVPWQRVVNVRGECSIRSVSEDKAAEQRRLLEREGVVFGAHGRVDLERFGWRPEEDLGRGSSKKARDDGEG